MYKIDNILDNYFIFNSDNVYIVKKDSTIGKRIKQKFKNGRIDDVSWERLYNLDSSSIDVIGIDDYEKYLETLKENIILSKQSIEKAKNKKNVKVNREKSRIINNKKIESNRVNRKKIKINVIRK